MIYSVGLVRVISDIYRETDQTFGQTVHVILRKKGGRAVLIMPEIKPYLSYSFWLVRQ